MFGLALATDWNDSALRALSRLRVWSLRMRRSPSIVPGSDQDVYLVLDDFGRSGQAWRETDAEKTGFETLITDLLDGQYNDPVQVIAFNTSEGWSRDVSEEVARELRQRCADQDRDLPLSLEPFVDRLAGGEVQSGNRPRQT
jgi:hypothetical protein